MAELWKLEEALRQARSERFERARALARQSLCTCCTAKPFEDVAREVFAVLLEGDDTLSRYAREVPREEWVGHCAYHRKEAGSCPPRR